jgi:hypothetical protein
MDDIKNPPSKNDIYAIKRGHTSCSYSVKLRVFKKYFDEKQ